VNGIATACAGGDFTPVPERREICDRVRVSPVSPAVEWRREVDLDPEAPEAAVAISEESRFEVAGTRIT
jgi:hypothetical protein